MVKTTLLFLLILGSLSSCKTYLIPLDSFESQFEGVDSSSLRKVQITGAVNQTYLANPIERIKCFDKDGNLMIINNSPSLEIRFTHGENNNKTIFYFDRVFKNDSLIIGGQSRFYPSLIKSIPIRSVSKIEIQDGGKNFRYIEQSDF